MLKNFQSRWQVWLPSFDKLLARTLSDAFQNNIESEALDQLLEAVSYSSLAGGKRMRALLVYLVADACSEEFSSSAPDFDTYPQIVHAAALAIEMMHCYSLIHDDLPAMDNDDLRRGQPTCHIKYGEALAILAGDGLQSLAFETISNPELGEPSRQLALVHDLSSAAGVLGMVGGQAIDLSAENQQLVEKQLSTLHHLKTGRLIEAAVSMGANCVGASPARRQDLARYASAIGLAFQVRDDIIDITSSSEKLGKPQGADQNASKSTYPSLLGLDGAREKAEALYDEALDALAAFGDRAQILKGLAEFFVRREH